MPDDDYPYLLNTGRLQHQWHTLTKTGKVAKLNKLNPGPFVEVHPRDAAALDLADGDLVEVASRRGRAVLPARRHRAGAPGLLFRSVPLERPVRGVPSVNAVTSDAVDPLSFQPELKACAVSMARVARPVTVQAPALVSAPAVARAASAGTVPTRSCQLSRSLVFLSSSIGSFFRAFSAALRSLHP